MPIYEFEGKKPKIHPRAFIAPTACVIGDVAIGEGSSVWPGAVVRGDLNPIVVGKYTSIQDNSVIHTDPGGMASIGDYVTVGHGAIVHGAEVGDHVLVGMRSILLNRARVGRCSVIAAGSVLLERTEIPPATMVAGTPAKVVKTLSEKEQEIRAELGAQAYFELARRHLKLFGGEALGNERRAL